MRYRFLMPCPIGPKLFWWFPNQFSGVQIILVRFKLDFSRIFFYHLDLSKMLWTQPKQIGPIQNDWYSSKIIWMVQNNFGPIVGQGIIFLHWNLTYLHSKSLSEKARLKATYSCLLLYKLNYWLA